MCSKVWAPWGNSDDSYFRQCGPVPGWTSGRISQAFGFPSFPRCVWAIKQWYSVYTCFRFLQSLTDLCQDGQPDAQSYGLGMVACEELECPGRAIDLLQSARELFGLWQKRPMASNEPSGHVASELILPPDLRLGKSMGRARFRAFDSSAWVKEPSSHVSHQEFCIAFEAPQNDHLLEPVCLRGSKPSGLPPSEAKLG